MSERTEQPTPRRLRKAREEGDSAVSLVLAQAFSLILAVSLGASFVDAVWSRGSTLLQAALSEQETLMSARMLPLIVLELSVPIILTASLASVMVGLVQTGASFTPRKLVPELSRLNPISGLRNVFSSQRLSNILRAVFAVALLTWFTLRALRDQAPALVHSVGDLSAALVTLTELALRLGWIAALIAVFMGSLDLLSVRNAWLKRLRMTKREVTQEFREAEGDPQLKAERRRAHQEALTEYSMASLDRATLLVESPERLVVALRYVEGETEAPIVTARGHGNMADRMLRAARSLDVPIHHAPEIANALRHAEIDSAIPSTLYDRVAELLQNSATK